MKIAEFVDPYAGRTWAELGVRILTSGTRVGVTLGYPVSGGVDVLASALREFLGTRDLELDVTFAPPRKRALGSVGEVIAVASGKGGVGKSTTAANLALALDREGAKVGVLDADIYGPSLGMMFGIAEGVRPEVRDGQFVPIKAHGVKVISMSMLVDERTPMVWRGPMASGALQQLLKQTRWDDVDYLIVDMPPGTGDIQLTLAQQVAVSGAVIVTTPQDIALLDARKGIEMFAKVDIPTLGVVENMSFHECSECGHRQALFGSGGGSRVADEFGVPLLAQLPLDPKIGEDTDRGVPPVAADPDGGVAAIYRDAARQIAARVWQSASEAPSIAMED